MNSQGAYNLIQVKNTSTSVIGMHEGMNNPLDLVKSLNGPSIVVNGGFFILYPEFYHEDEKGEPLHQRFYTYPVGETSLTQDYVRASDGYKDLLKLRTMTNGTTYTTGPSLKSALPFVEPDFTAINSKAGRFNYYAMDSNGSKIKSPLWASLRTWDDQYEDLQKLKEANIPTTLSVDIEVESLTAAAQKPIFSPDGSFSFASGPPRDRYIRGVWPRVPGSLSHVKQPNERSGISRHEGSELFHAYTSQRSQGLTMNDFRTLMQEGTRFVGLSLENIPDDDAWANDGGPSIFQFFVGADGTKRLLASGGLNEQSFEPSINLKDMRKVPNAVVARVNS
ncbi:hypothetical protein BD779DRAFT_1672852 [Infundibulicybe gibba]|nr:hypothetical protein BD779DRAFT_1672852 [Infundibulicybe gibba]